MKMAALQMTESSRCFPDVGINFYCVFYMAVGTV